MMEIKERSRAEQLGGMEDCFEEEEEEERRKVHGELRATSYELRAFNAEVRDSGLAGWTGLTSEVGVEGVAGVAGDGSCEEVGDRIDQFDRGGLWW